MSDDLIKIDPQFADALAAAGIRVNQIRRRTLLQIHAILFSQYCRTYWRAPSYELTTGADVFDVVTHDAETCTACAPLVGPLFPRQPQPPCTCHYRLHTAQLPYQVGRTTVRRRTVVLGSYFTIDPWCPHHAPVRVGGWEAFPDWPYEVVLDEDTRRGY
jgi:hypothetical protein